MTYQFDFVFLCSLILVGFLSLALEGLGRELISALHSRLAVCKLRHRMQKLTLSWNNDSTISAVSHTKYRIAYSLDDSLLYSIDDIV
jgi:hypothetical protein